MRKVYKLGVLKEYTDKKFKLIVHKVLTAGEYENYKKHAPKGSVNDEKLESNIARAKGQIYEYAICNKWKYFCNLTLDKKKYDRYELDIYRKHLTQWLRNYSKKHGIKIAYLFIPEHHKDGAWHIHGFLEGLPEEHLTEFIKGKHPKNLIDKGYKNWESYAAKFGFVSVAPIKSKEAISKYITKYINKSMAQRNKELGAHLYCPSRGLKKAETIKKGTMSDNIIPDYENDYVKILWVENRQVALSYFEVPAREVTLE